MNGGILPVIGNDIDKDRLWNLMQRFVPGANAYWLWYKTDALGEQDFVDKRGDKANFEVKLDGTAREGINVNFESKNRGRPNITPTQYIYP